MNRSALSLVLVAVGALSSSAWAETRPTKAEVARYANAELAASYTRDAPGAAVLVTRGDEVLYRGARGVADVATGKPLTADAVFRIGSVSKQFAAVGVLKLVEAGKMSLDDTLSRYVPNYPNGAKITVRELLNHTAGIKNYTSAPGWVDGPIDTDRTTAQMIASFQDDTPDFAPGKGWNYSNSGYILVGAVIEAASGKPWYQYLQDTLFTPLGLDHTGYGGNRKLAARMVPGYSLDDTGKVIASRKISMSVPHAAGALLSTVDDLQKWNRALHEGKVLEDATYLAMITPVGKAAEQHYGFGIETGTVQGHPVLRHSGGIFGFASMLEYVPGPDISVVMLQNSDANAGHPDTAVLANRLVASALGEPYPEAKPIAIGAASLPSLEGVYRLDKDTARVLRVVDGKLTSQRIGGQQLVLIPIGIDEFLFEEDGVTRFVIQRDAKGKVTGMRFFANGEPPGMIATRTTEPMPAIRQPVTLPRAVIDRVIGTYVVGEGQLTVFLEGETLKTQMAGQPAFDLFAESPDVFFLTVADATLTFAAAPGPAASVTLRQGGRTIELKRKP